jgi:hypothetical protein
VINTLTNHCVNITPISSHSIDVTVIKIEVEYDVLNINPNPNFDDVVIYRKY